MTLQNRVTPLGELVAEPGRRLVYGNRGCLHDATGPRHEVALLITPPSLIAVLPAGWQPLVPLLHPSALSGGA